MATQRYVALLRGINVGRAKRIAMADLRALLEALGHGDVKTLLNSGNAVFAARATPPAKLAARIQAAIAAELGVDTLVIVKSAAEIAAVVADNRLATPGRDGARLLVALAHDPAAIAGLLASAGHVDLGADELHIGPHAAYLWCADGLLASKAAVALLGGLRDSGTTRNWSTIGKLHTLLTKDGPA